MSQGVHTGALQIRNPRLARLYAYWQARRGERLMPSRGDIDPIEMKEWLGNLVLIEFLGGGVENFRIRVDGTNIAEYSGSDRTGTGAERITSAQERRVLFVQYGAVLDQRRPAYHETEFTNSEGRFMREEKLLLPLSADGDTVNMVLAGIYYVPLQPRPSGD